jgi:adenosyl cobinamide kinase/adenosyl cobinamide phosphate guanylyltransferase
LHQSHLILGGARSGKSRHAVAEARAARSRAAFVVTAEPLHGDMRERIARHRGERPADWFTVEEPVEVVAAARRAARQCDLVVVDCVTIWVSNQMARGRTDAAVLAAAEGLAALAGERLASLVIVSNEAGQGVHPETALGCRFRDLLGSVNQVIAAAADRVTLMVAGIPIEIKRVSPPAMSHERPPEAP